MSTLVTVMLRKLDYEVEDVELLGRCLNSEMFNSYMLGTIKFHPQNPQTLTCAETKSCCEIIENKNFVIRLRDSSKTNYPRLG